MAFNIKVTSGSPSLPTGQYRADIEEGYLRLSKRKEPILDIPSGTAAKYREKNRLAIKLADGQIELAVSKFGSYENRLAKDLASFLNGERETPILSQYTLPWYFWLISALPLGIPIICLGGALPGAVGAGFAYGCLAIMQNEEWPGWLRVVISLSLATFAYALFFGAALAWVILRGNG